MSKITPTFLFLAVALIIWSAAASLSSYLSNDFAREHAAEGGASRGNVAQTPEQSAHLSHEIESLREQISSGSTEPAVYLNLAYALLQQAHSTNDTGAIMESVKTLHDLMKIHPDHPDALLALATICLQTGIIDKALEYYPRYLELRGDDARARSDYSLALVQAGREQDALAQVELVLAKDNSFVPALMARAIAYRSLGELQKSEEAASTAREAAQEPELKARITGFINELKKGPPADEAAASSGSAAESEDLSASPARMINDYFRAHAILGPKVRRIDWPEANVAAIALDNFPVHQMPEFAKQKFIGGVRQHFAVLKQKFTIQLRDAASGEQLMELEVGGE